MKNVKLIRIESQNFMGVKEFDFNFDEKDVIIKGDNHIGKSTIKTMYSWLFTGKDSNGNDESNFGLRPYDTEGNPIHNIIISVAITLKIDDVFYTFERKKVEKFSKSRGEENSGKWVEATECLINSVPKKVTEFENEVKALLDIDQAEFSLLTNPDSFNSLHWKKQREVLVKLSKGITDLEMLHLFPELSALKRFLNEGKSVEDIKKIVEKEIPQLKAKVDAMPIAINELANINYGDVENWVNETYENAKLGLEAFKEELMSLSLNKVNPYEETIKSLQDELSKLHQERVDKFKVDLSVYTNKTREHQFKVIEVNKKLNDLESKFKNLEFDINRTKDLHANCVSLREDLLKEYREIQAREFTNDKCSLCGQTLPQEKLDKALEDFNSLKAHDLEENIKKGKANKVSQENHLELINDLELKKLAIAKEIEKVKDEIKGLENVQIEEPKTVKSQREIDLEKEIESLKSKVVIETTNDKEKEIQEKIDKVNRDLKSYELKLIRDEKIEKLKEEQKVLGENLIDDQDLKELCSKFIALKCKLIEAEINNSFNKVNFKLFDTQKNGLIVETCEAVFNGVPFRNLSNSEKINAGLDVIKTLNNIYHISLPVFIDNAECITSIEKYNFQTIKLYVEEHDEPRLEFIYE